MSCSRCEECQDYWPDTEIVHATVDGKWKVLCIGCHGYLRDQSDATVSEDWLAALVEEVAESLRPDYGQEEE